MSGKYSQKRLDHAYQSATDALKTTSKRVIRKAAGVTADLICNKIANKITGFQKIHNKTTPKQLQIMMIKKYLKKDIYL